VLDNISICMSLSSKIIVVLSPTFLASQWCNYETRLTFEMHVDSQSPLLIPVMLTRCEVPAFIGRMTYMEVDNEHFFSRLVDAILETGIVYICLTGVMDPRRDSFKIYAF